MKMKNWNKRDFFLFSTDYKRFEGLEASVLILAGYLGM